MIGIRRESGLCLLPPVLASLALKTLSASVFLGELSLDGTVRSVRDALSARVRRIRAHYPELRLLNERAEYKRTPKIGQPCEDTLLFMSKYIDKKGVS